MKLSRVLSPEPGLGLQWAGGSAWYVPLLGLGAAPPFFLAPRKLKWLENPLENSEVNLDYPRFALALSV